MAREKDRGGMRGRTKEKPFPYAEIEKKLGYTFKNKKLLLRAFTHSSYTNVHGGEDNERMEFLGDAVLKLATTELLYFHRDEQGNVLNEGEMTAIRQTQESKAALLKIIKNLRLKEYLRYEGGDSNVGEKTVSSLFETVLAAVYLDGGYLAAKEVTERNVPPVGGKKDYKSALQTYLQGKKKPLPVYTLLEKMGKDHAPTFFVKAEAAGKVAKGQGGSLSAAQQQAASELLEMLQEK